jgi:hypothetical protein
LLSACRGHQVNGKLLRSNANLNQPLAQTNKQIYYRSPPADEVIDANHLLFGEVFEA